MGIYENARNATKNKIIRHFWEIYKMKPIERITVREVADASGIGRGTFYNHFQDVYGVLETIEAELSLSLNHMCADIRKGTPSLNELNRVLYEYYDDEKTKDYINLLVLEHRDPFFAKEYIKEMEEAVRDVCVAKEAELSSEKDKMIVAGAITAVTDLLLNCICRSSLSIQETDELILGLMQNGFYVTLTNRFGIHALKNPFALSGIADR